MLIPEITQKVHASFPPKARVHWTDLTHRFVDELGISGDDLIRSMNALLFENSISGINHYYWLGPITKQPDQTGKPNS